MNQTRPNGPSDLPDEPQTAADEAEPQEAAEPEPAEVDPAARIAELEAEAAELKDRMLRAMAETENLRRRSARDVEDARKYAVTGFARELLDVADNLGRALASIPSDARNQDELVRTLADGVEMTQRTLAACFERQQITRIEPQLGDKFDHNLHQAMFETETDQQPAGTIAQVLQAGYVIADRLLRPALVGVAKRPAAADGSPFDADDGGRAGQPGQRIDTTA